MKSKYSLDNISMQKGAVWEASPVDEEWSFSFQLDSSRNTSRMSNNNNRFSESLINYSMKHELDDSHSIHSSPSVNDIEATPQKNSDIETPSP